MAKNKSSIQLSAAVAEVWKAVWGTRLGIVGTEQMNEEPLNAEDLHTVKMATSEVEDSEK